MNTSTLPQTATSTQSRYAILKELVAILIEDLKPTSKIILMEQLQIIDEANDYMTDVMVAQLEGILYDYGIAI